MVAHESLLRLVCAGVVVRVVPSHATFQYQLVLLLVVEVGTEHLRGVQTVLASAPSAAATAAWESAVAGVVHVAEEHHAHVAVEVSSHQS